MTRTGWPRLCTLAEAARLFTEAGRPVHRSNVSRWVKDRDFAKTDGKVDPTALFAAMESDFGLETMRKGQPATAAPAAAPASLPPDDDLLPRDDPKRDLARIQARMAQLALDEKLGKTVPAEEAAAAIAESLAELRSTGLRIARDEAARLLADVGAPGHKLGAATAALKRYLHRLQEAYATEALKLLEASSTPDAPARLRLDALVALDLDMRGEGGDETEDPAPEPAATAPAEPVAT